MRNDLIIAVIGTLWLAGSTLAGAAAPSSDAIRDLVERGTRGELRQPVSTEARDALRRFYAPRVYAPAWFAADQPPALAASALAQLRAAPTHGLDAEDYAVDALTREAQAIADGDRSPERVARADVALTLALARYLFHLRHGRVGPREAGFQLGEADSYFDVGALLQRALAEQQLSNAIADAEPTLAIHRRLEVALARYRELAIRALPPLPELPRGTTKIEAGGSYSGAQALAERLRLEGDLAADAAAPADRYDGALVGALQSFQERHGLKPDGVLGRETLAALKVPLERRVRQIELAIERLRWLPRFAPGPLVAVNVPSFRLWAFDAPGEPGTPALTMPVIVGRAAGARKTPIFIGEMRYVEFSPYWNVPPNIQRNELVPRLASDPDYLLREEMEMVPVRGVGAPSTTVDPETLSALAKGALRIRQRPGPKNALGGIKFVLPNTMDIYLHGTPSVQLFERTRRDFSHGCIRVADPLALARFALRGRADWTEERMRAAMNEGTPVGVPLVRPMPVVIFYTTAVVDNDGRALFLPDLYGYDGKLEAALRERKERAN